MYFLMCVKVHCRVGASSFLSRAVTARTCRLVFVGIILQGLGKGCALKGLRQGLCPESIDFRDQIESLRLVGKQCFDEDTWFAFVRGGGGKAKPTADQRQSKFCVDPSAATQVCTNHLISCANICAHVYEKSLTLSRVCGCM